MAPIIVETVMNVYLFRPYIIYLLLKKCALSYLFLMVHLHVCKNNSLRFLYTVYIYSNFYLQHVCNLGWKLYNC